MPAVAATENQWLEMGFIALLALFCALFFWTVVSFWRFRDPSPDRPPLPKDPRPPLKFASVYDYLQRAHFVPLLFSINIAIIVIAVAMETRGAGNGIRLSIMPFIVLTYLTDYLQQKSFWNGNTVISLADSPELYGTRVRQLFGLYLFSTLLMGVLSFYHPFR